MATTNGSAPPSSFKIALIQTCPRPNKPAENFKVAAAYIKQGAERGAKLAILPEYHLTAFEPNSADFIPACQSSHGYVKAYQDLAKQLDICIVPGTIVLTPSPEDPDVIKYDEENRPSLLNTAYFIDNQGEILGDYTKTNLWHPERDHLTSSIEHHYNELEKIAQEVPNTSGRANEHQKPSTHEEHLPEPHKVIDTPLGKIGIVVCWDLAFPEAFRSLIMQGAKIILVPTYWVDGDMSPEGLKHNPNAESLFLSTTLIARAYENTAAIVFCNAGGPKADGFIGLSQVALPIVGKLPGSFEGSDEGLRVVDVNMEIVEIAERNYKVREDLARDDWHYGYAR